jgi:hypothetical protein
MFLHGFGCFAPEPSLSSLPSHPLPFPSSGDRTKRSSSNQIDQSGRDPRGPVKPQANQPNSRLASFLSYQAIQLQKKKKKKRKKRKIQASFFPSPSLAKTPQAPLLAFCR